MTASGTTSSRQARQEKTGRVIRGATIDRLDAADQSIGWAIATAIAPISSAPMIGGNQRASRGRALSSTKASTIGPATIGSWWTALTRSSPKRRKTPATMAITIGMGSRAWARRIHPEIPSTVTKRPVATKAPITSACGVCSSAWPTRTVPGMVQKITSGVRKRQLSAIVTRPLRKKAPNSHDASSACPSPPCDPDASTIATGPVAAKMKPTRPLTA